MGTGCIPLPLPESCQVSLVMSCWLLQKWLGMLYCQCVGVRHMIQDCVQTLLHMLQCVLRVGLAGLVIPGQIVIGLFWTGRMLLPAPVLTLQSVWRIWEPWDCATHKGLICSVSFPWIVVDSSCSLEAFDGGFCLLIGDIVGGGVFTLKVVWRLLFCFNVFV